MSEITAATVEQSAGIDQINLAIAQMDTVTQQNAALVQEAAHAAVTLQDQLLDVNTAISVFHLTGDEDNDAVMLSHRHTDKGTDTDTPAPTLRLRGEMPAVAPIKALGSPGGRDDEWKEF
jgi:hypothetical protein